MLARAAAEPNVLVIGLDASRDGMLEAAARVQKASKRGILTNACFVVAAAEALPSELDSLAHEVTFHFPWGSLLRGLLAPEASLLAGLARVLRPGGSAKALLSLTPRDRQSSLPHLDDAHVVRLAPGYAAHGLQLVDWRPATVAEVEEAHSTWAKRLGAGRARPVWYLRARRAG